MRDIEQDHNYMWGKIDGYKEGFSAAYMLLEQWFVEAHKEDSTEKPSYAQKVSDELCPKQRKREVAELKARLLANLREKDHDEAAIEDPPLLSESLRIATVRETLESAAKLTDTVFGALEKGHTEP